MENTDRIVPEIDFGYWYGVNQKAGENLIINIGERRHLSMINLIVGKRDLYNNLIKEHYHNNILLLPYFIDDVKQIDYLSSLTYNELENEILNHVNSFDFEKSQDYDLLKIFDLIQIWGGGPSQGGGGPYNISKKLPKIPSRLMYDAWLNNYKNIIKKAVEKKIEAYDLLLRKNSKVPYLALSFGSKHISFWSRKDGNEKCLVVIDNKIAGTTGNDTPVMGILGEIVNDIHCYSNENKHGLKPHQIEKALFSFHAHYFDNKNETFTGIEKVDDIDYQVAVAVAEKLGIDGNPSNKNPSKLKPSGQNKSNKNQNLKLAKGDYLKSETGDIFISAVYVEKNKLKKNVDMANKANKKGKDYFKFKGESDSIKLL